MKSDQGFRVSLCSRNNRKWSWAGGMDTKSREGGGSLALPGVAVLCEFQRLCKLSNVT